MSAHTEFSWELVDTALADLMLYELAEEMRQLIEEDRRRISFENRANGNVLAIPTLCLQMHVRRADEWARRVYDVYREVWQRQGNALSPEFLRAVGSLGIATVLAARTNAVVDGLQREATLTRMYPTEWVKAATAEFRRAMQRLVARWLRRVEIEAKTLEHENHTVDPAGSSFGTVSMNTRQADFTDNNQQVLSAAQKREIGEVWKGFASDLSSACDAFTRDLGKREYEFWSHDIPSVRLGNRRHFEKCKRTFLKSIEEAIRNRFSQLTNRVLSLEHTDSLKHPRLDWAKRNFASLLHEHCKVAQAMQKAPGFVLLDDSPPPGIDGESIEYLAAEIQRQLDSELEDAWRAALLDPKTSSKWHTKVRAEGSKDEPAKRQMPIKKPSPARDASNLSWNNIRIVFLSDERVQIFQGAESETRNYAELGFADRRTGKPNCPWITLRVMAEQHGVIKDSGKEHQTWSKVEKRVQEIRKVLRQHFGIGGDPIPFLSGVGYRSCFKIECSPAYHT